MNTAHDEEELVIITGLLGIIVANSAKRNLPKTRVTPYLQHRKVKGRFATDFMDMVKNPSVFRENFHMCVPTFQALFKLVEPLLAPKRNTRPYDKISPLEKFAIVIEYLASGSIQRHVASVYRISKQHFGRIINKVCSAICDTLCNEIPSLNEEEFVRISNEFNAQWNLPNCLGAIDGKHVAIKCPPSAGSLFYNYKGFHSIVRMAISDANYKFVYLDIGAYGSEGDASVFSSTELGRGILEDSLQFPQNMQVGNEKLPYFFVGDDAFPLKKRLIKPYAPRKPKKLSDEERIANYRISRARRCVENSFGILCSKWICLGRIMFWSPDKAQNIIGACCYSHNYLIRTSKLTYWPPKYADFYDESGCLVNGEWRKHVSQDALLHSTLQSMVGRQSDEGKYLRDKLKEFVNSPIGSIPWQNTAAFL